MRLTNLKAKQNQTLDTMQALAQMKEYLTFAMKLSIKPRVEPDQEWASKPSLML